MRTVNADFTSANCVSGFPCAFNQVSKVWKPAFFVLCIQYGNGVQPVNVSVLSVIYKIQGGWIAVEKDVECASH